MVFIKSCKIKNFDKQEKINWWNILNNVFSLLNT